MRVPSTPGRIEVETAGFERVELGCVIGKVLPKARVAAFVEIELIPLELDGLLEPLAALSRREVGLESCFWRALIPEARAKRH